MLKKRLIGVVTVKDGWAVQSFGYGRYLPLGKPECLVENLDRWGADEILVQVIDRSRKQCGPDYELLAKLASLGLGTPLIYSGGISTMEEGIKAIQCGADRLSVDALLTDDLPEVYALSNHLGAQALIAALPVAYSDKDYGWYDYREKTSRPVNSEIKKIIRHGIVSETLLIDWTNEGMPGKFDARLIDHFPVKNIPLIVFGGISTARQIVDILGRPDVVAAAIGNFLSYREHAIQKLRIEAAISTLRPPLYTSYYSLGAHV